MSAKTCPKCGAKGVELCWPDVIAYACGSVGTTGILESKNCLRMQRDAFATRVARLESVLREIVGQDYRGNRPTECGIAARVLEEKP